MAKPAVLAVALLMWELTAAVTSTCIYFFLVDFCSHSDYVTDIFFDSALYLCRDAKGS